MVARSNGRMLGWQNAIIKHCDSDRNAYVFVIARLPPSSELSMCAALCTIYPPSPTQAPHTGGNKSLQPGEGSSVAARGGAHRCKGQFVAVDNSLHSGRPFCHSTILPLYHSTIKPSTLVFHHSASLKLNCSLSWVHDLPPWLQRFVPPAPFSH